LLRYLRPQWPALTAALGIALLGAVVALAQPLLAGRVVEGVGDGGVDRRVVVSAAVLVAALLLTAVLSGVQSYLLTRTGEAVVRDTRLRLVGRLIRLPVAEYDRRRSGDLLSRVGSDTTLLRAVVQSGLVEAAAGAVTAVGALVLMAVVDPVLLAVTVVAVGVVVAVAGTIVPRIQRLSRQAQEAVGEMTAGVERVLGAVRTVRAAVAEDREEAVIAASVRSAFAAGVRLARVQAILAPVASIAVQGAFIAVLGIGGARVAAGQATVAELVTFVFLLFLLVQPLASAIQAATAVQTGLGAVQRIDEILALRPEGVDDAQGELDVVVGREADVGVERGIDRAPAQGPDIPPVEVREVSFGYPGGPEVLHGVSFTAVRSGTTALVGPSGAGKSTIFSLIERFYDVTEGAVLVEGQDVRRVPHAELRRRMAYVEQDAPALAGTIRENLLLGAPEAAEAELLDALESVNLRGLVDRSLLGLDAPVGDDGVLLSGGERQRLAIARALLARPAVLLLDEPTSNLDAGNEAALHEAMAVASRLTTVIVIAHRLSTVVGAARIVLLDAGRVVATGTHRELLAASPMYRSLADRQFLA
jgi:ABC-type multidrug transport system fused ATPase/permease subunit